MYAFHKGRTLRKSTFLRWDEQNKEAALALLDQQVMGMIHPELLPKKPIRLLLLKDAQTEFWAAREHDLTRTQKYHYKRAFNRYFAGLDLESFVLNDDDLYAHIRDINQSIAKEIRDSTREKYLQYLRMFLDFCCQRKWLTENAVKIIGLPEREEKEDVEVFETQEIMAFIKHFQNKALDQQPARSDQKNAALFALNIKLLWLTAMRPGETIKMQWSHIGDNSFKIIGKRNRDKKPNIRHFPLTLGNVDPRMLAEAGSVNRIEMWLAEVRQVIQDLRAWQGRFGDKVFPWKDAAAISQALRQAKQDLEYPEDDGRTVKTIRATAVNRWEDELGIDWVTACDLAGHNPAVRYKYYRKKRTPEKIIAAVARDAVRIAGLDGLQTPYKTPSIH